MEAAKEIAGDLVDFSLQKSKDVLSQIRQNLKDSPEYPYPRRKRIFSHAAKGKFFFYEFALLAIATCGVAIGLIISIFSSNTDMAVTAVPLAIIPQVILAGKI